MTTSPTTFTAVPFTLDLDPAAIDDLRDRLRRTRWPQQLPGSTDWAKGVPVEAARRWAGELAEFDWLGLQDELNALAQFTTEIDGETIHFVHQRLSRDDATPLILLHGWPGTVDSIARFMTDGNGYNVIQSTRPQTIGYGLEDSPVAQLTWIVEKVHEWTHDPAVLENPHYRRRHLANVLLYWLTRTATSAADTIYAGYGELFADPTAFANSGVPTAVIAYAEDPSIRRFAEQGNTIVRWTDVADGGHFAALEQPDSLIADLREFTTGLG